ncbi:hypothetical protein NQ176_g3911 [Zarea fungicola]|uniref:Uncharacterized protein n=1 Tax=Zarea fungicola TaxID=93591 RepID=A0ACC1NGU8_9HYPO|nr:hypothetical protein NQ176_g3911 [Lecanicillium fungicola]
MEISPAVNITCRVESPPIVFHGPSEETVGAFFSGQLAIEVNEDVINIESLVAEFMLHIVYKRPFQSHCKECQNNYIQLETWQLIRETKTLLRGTHFFPFSTHLDGSQPTSTDTPVFSITYKFKAEAIVCHQLQGLQTIHTNEQPMATPSTSSLRLKLVIPVKRCIQEPLYPSFPRQTFPPTGITAIASYIPTIYPTTTNTLHLKVDGLVSTAKGHSDAPRWMLRQVKWQLEENIKATVPACERHHRGAHVIHGNIRGIFRDQARVIGEKELQQGWKSIKTSPSGTIEVEIEFGLG